MHDYDIVGFQYDDSRRGAAYGISSGRRIHMAVFGLVGSGKSSILKLLILQNIKRGQGFMVVDPHGELARQVLAMMPKSRHDDVIYVSPASLHRFGATIKINPLEVERPEERYLVVMTFVNALYNIYKDSWGPRLETILRNAANALVETQYNTLGNLSGMVTDPEVRRRILRQVSSRGVRHFWSDIYEKQYARDAGSAAYNKMDKILATPAVAAMFDAARSSVSFSDIIRNNRMVVVDLGTGASDDVAAFVGTILLNMLYVEAKKRLDLHDGESVRQNPFYVYVDEAHLFSNDTMSEMLRALRKFGVRMTVATQTANAYSKTFADQITGICQCIICGHCDGNTAKLLHRSMGVEPPYLEKLPNHTFAFYSAEGGSPVTGTFRTRPVPPPGQDLWEWSEVARHSVNLWGERVENSGGGRIADVMMSPLETAILSAIYGRRSLDRSGVADAVSHMCGGRRAVSALTDVLMQALGFVERDDAHAYRVSREAMQSYFSRAGWGRRAGGDTHLGVIFAVMEHNVRAGRYCIPDLGQRGGERPDLLVYEPAVVRRGGAERPDPDRWNERALAVEVETGPGKHRRQIVANHSKNAKSGYPVWFLVFDQKSRDVIRDALDGAGIDRATYHTDVVDAAGMISGRVMPPVPFLRGEYSPLY